MRLVFHPASAFSYLGLVIAWSVVWALVDEIVIVLAMAAVALLAIWSVVSLARSRGHPEIAKLRIKESVFTITYAVAATITLLTALPYLLFHDAFLNTYLALWMYLLPVAFVLFFLIHAFHHYFSDNKVHIIPAMKIAIMGAIMLLVLLSAGLFAAERYAKQYIINQSEFAEGNAFVEEPPQLPDYPLSRELRAELSSANKQVAERREPAASHDWESVLDASVDSTASIVSVGRAHSRLAIFNATLRRMQDANYSDGQKLFILERLRKDTEALKPVAQPRFDEGFSTYSELVATYEAATEGVILEFAYLFGDHSALSRALSYAASHTEHYAMIVRSLYTLSNRYAEDIGFDPDDPLYMQKDIEEPTESKIGRYMIIYSEKCSEECVYHYGFSHLFEGNESAAPAAQQ